MLTTLDLQALPPPPLTDSGPLTGLADPDDLSAVSRRILAATIEVASQHGIAHLSVGDVARRARLSRQTVYKHFQSKEALLQHAIVQEAATVLGHAVHAMAEGGSGREALAVGLSVALRGAAEHPLLQRLVQTEPQALLPLVTHSDGPVMAHTRAVLQMVLARHFQQADALRLELAVDVATRLLVSLSVSPSRAPAADLASLLADALAAILEPRILSIHTR